MKEWFLRIEAITDRVAAEGLAKLAPYTPEACAELHAMLDRTREAAGGNDTVLRRVEFLRSAITFAEVQAKTHAFAAEHRDQRPSPEEMERFRAEMEVKFRLLRRTFREEPLALNTPLIAWGSEGAFRRFGWNGAKSLPTDRWDADEEGRFVPPPPGPDR